MNFSSCIIFIIFFIYRYGSCLGILKNEGDELIGVAVLYRHGDRGPLGSYPDDPFHDIKYWPNGFGQLLDKGKQRQFNLGKWFRSRYNSFLPEQYNYQDILVKSSDVDRTLMSAASNLAGLYYPTNKSSHWQKNLAWDPIPIHTESQSNDNIISMSKNCPNFDTLYNSTLYSTYFENLLKKYNEIKSFVEINTGWDIKDITSFQGLYSVFYVYSEHNVSYIPEWAYGMNLTDLKHLAGISYSTETFTIDLQRYKVGPFFNFLHNYFDGIINGTNPKFLMLSGHDGTIAGILNTYGVYDYLPPEFCETVIWELYKSAGNGVYLKIYKKNSDGLEELQITNCSQQCNYGQYLEILDSVSVDSDTWEKECNIKLLP